MPGSLAADEIDGMKQCSSSLPLVLCLTPRSESFPPTGGMYVLALRSLRNLLMNICHIRICRWKQKRLSERVELPTDSPSRCPRPSRSTGNKQRLTNCGGRSVRPVQRYILLGGFQAVLSARMSYGTNKYTKSVSHGVVGIQAHLDTSRQPCSVPGGNFHPM